MSRTIVVHVIDPVFGKQTVTVRSDDPVSVLCNHIQTKKRFKTQLVYRGSVIIPSFSFAYFGIEDGATVSVVRIKVASRPTHEDYFKHNMRKKIRMQLQQLRDSSPMVRLLIDLWNPEFMAELARLADLRALSWETKRLPVDVSPATPVPGKVTAASDLVTHVSGEARRPSTEALPMVW